MSTTVTPERDGEPQLARVMGPKLLLLFVVGDILGASIYSLTGKVAGLVGGALWLPFLIAFALAFLTAFSYLELVGKYPRAAGAALYTHRAFGVHLLTFLVAFAVMCSGITSAASAAEAFSGDYLQEFVSAPESLVAFGFLALIAVINFRGVGVSVKLNVLLTAVELTGLLVVIAVGFLAVVQGAGEPARLLEVNSEAGVFFGVTSATALAFFSLVGFEDSVNMVEETRDPVRIFPRAILTGIVICAAIYLLVAVASSLLVPVHVLAGSTAPLLEVVRAGAPWFPLLAFAAIALFSVVNSALINMMMASRLLYGMAREGLIPAAFGTVHRTRRTPWAAILFTSLLGIGLVAALDISALGGTTSLLLLIVFAVVNVAVLVLRREPADHEHFRAPTAVPVLGALSCAFFASPLTGRDPAEYVVVAVLLGTGLVFWGLNQLALRRGRSG
ncbi:amino acid permease [Saccharopolyspora sp. HNM0983]|uniref:Amino acid permease n=1 Tax=Saccharopolyspora montiporae TaxID=2781240 RepID=A0A929B9H2_9PSEU|nr:APC family permease [Saccharopolyspora sp. HNM0983]MBE9374290.1 amino acid permease [Saccharopolyspora sp. HNM0983]